MSILSRKFTLALTAAAAVMAAQLIVSTAVHAEDAQKTKQAASKAIKGGKDVAGHAAEAGKAGTGKVVQTGKEVAGHAPAPAKQVAKTAGGAAKTAGKKIKKLIP